MENARMIHNTILKVLEEKSQIKAILADLNDEAQAKNT